MNDDDQEVANILQDYIKSNGIPKGAGTRSKFNRLVNTFKESHQLGYHKYVFQPDYPGTPKPTTENFDQNLSAWTSTISQNHKTLLEAHLDQQFMEKSIVHLKCNSDKGCYRVYDKWLPRNHRLRRAQTPQPKQQTLGAKWYAETINWMKEVSSIAEGPDFKLHKIKSGYSLVFKLPSSEIPTSPERSRFKNEEDFSKAVDVFVSLVNEKNEELKKELEAERKKVEDASVALTSSTDEITIDFGSDSIRGSQEEYRLMTQWTETRQKLIDEVHQSVQWKILQSNENGYRLDFPEVWSWVSQDEWMTEYNSKLRKLKKVAVAMSDRSNFKNGFKKILTFKKSVGYQYLISNGIERPKTPDLHKAHSPKEVSSYILEWKQEVYKLLPDDSLKNPMYKWNRKVAEFKESSLFNEYTAALASGQLKKTIKQPWFRTKWKSDEQINEQILIWSRQIEKALKQETMPTDMLPSLPAPVGPASNLMKKNCTNNVRITQIWPPEEPPSKIIKLEDLPQPAEHSTRDRICEPVDMEIDTVKLEPDNIEIIDLHYIQSLEPEALLKYVQKQSKFYTDYVDDDSRSFIGSLVGACTQFVPCGKFNKDDSCSQDFIHTDKNGEKRIHSCVLCYFVLSGMISMHRLPNCPLLKKKCQDSL